jgi:hypothetical protein
LVERRKKQNSHFKEDVVLAMFAQLWSVFVSSHQLVQVSMVMTC